MGISLSLQILPRSEVLSLLGIKEEFFKVLPTFSSKSSLLLPPMETQDIILSPSRHRHRSAADLCQLADGRENAATPTLEAMGDFDLNESVISEVSGYEGDMDEEEEDSFFTWSSKYLVFICIILYMSGKNLF